MAKEMQRILITVKTYPTPSRKYIETVCTAGVREDGTWVRIYPVPFRGLDSNVRYKKYDWIECRLERITQDPRPESYSPIALHDLRRIDHMSTSSNWRARRQLLLGNSQVYHRLKDLINEAKENRTSLATFKPTKVIDLIAKKTETQWNNETIEKVKLKQSQLGLFDEDSWQQTLRVVKKLPYKFSYRFKDITGKESTLQILDWEIGALYWNCLKSEDQDHEQAVNKVRRKYFEEFAQTDLHFFLGTTQQFHRVSPNPWLIIGVFPIPEEPQIPLF